MDLSWVWSWIYTTGVGNFCLILSSNIQSSMHSINCKHLQCVRHWIKHQEPCEAQDRRSPCCYRTYKLTGENLLMNLCEQITARLLPIGTKNSYLKKNASKQKGQATLEPLDCLPESNFGRGILQLVSGWPHSGSVCSRGCRRLQSCSQWPEAGCPLLWKINETGRDWSIKEFSFI